MKREDVYAVLFARVLVVYSCTSASLCKCVFVCVCVHASAYSLAVGQAGLGASNICRGLARVLHGGAAEDT